MSKILYVLTALLCLTVPAFAQTPPNECRPFIKELELIGNAGLMPMILEDADRLRAVAFLNAQPPVTNDTYEIVIAIPQPQGGGFVALGNKGEICFRGVYSAEMFRAFIRASMGDPA